MFEDFNSVDEDHRDVPGISLAEGRVVIDVDFLQQEFSFATGGEDRCFCFLAQMTAGSGEDRHSSWFHEFTRRGRSPIGLHKHID